MMSRIIILVLTIIFVLGILFVYFSRLNQSGQTVGLVSTSSTTEGKSDSCPSGFIKVPGNAQYQTADFCIMKYDAKCADTSNPTVGLQPHLGDPSSGESNGHAYGTYKNNGVGAACVPSNNKQVVSTVSGFPITYIPELGNGTDNAQNYCAQMGWHLITNNEWMVIARNVERVPANWCDKNGTNCGFPPGALGKILANGHNDSNNESSAGGSNHDSALIAGQDNQPCLGTTTDGSNICGGESSQKRTLVLSNGNIIWDFAGNVWQWVEGTVLRKDEPKSKSNGKLDMGWLSSEFAPGALPSVIIDNGQEPSLGYNSFRPSDPAWNSNNGAGRIFHYSGATDTNTTIYGFIRGGQWNHGAVDGAFSIHLTPVPNKTNINDVGFRCAANLSQ